MIHEIVAAPAATARRCPYEWLGRVLVHFSVAEQAIGTLCLALDLPLKSGPLTNLVEARRRLIQSGDKKLRILDKRIERWKSYRAMRNLLAHSTLYCLSDGDGREIIVTRCLPLDKEDVTPDRMWTPEEREELLRQATNDGRSIADHVRNVIGDQALLHRLRTTPLPCEAA